MSIIPFDLEEIKVKNKRCAGVAKQNPKTNNPTIFLAVEFLCQCGTAYGQHMDDRAEYVLLLYLPP